MRVATCTPVDFRAEAQFFGRDSGLLCRGFQKAGHQAFVVMPGLPRPDDETGVLRCAPAELESASWWRARQLDIVVLYAWGDPRYRRVANAIRSAGVTLVQSLDTAGFATPYGQPAEWWRSFVGMVAGSRGMNYKTHRLALACRDLLPWVFETKRLSMIDCSDAVAVVSAPAADSVCAYARSLGFPQVADKVMVVPHPVSPLMIPKGEKPKKVLVVGRWLQEDHHQKDPRLTMLVLAGFLARYPGWNAEIVGRGSPALRGMLSGLDDSLSGRVTFTEAVPRTELVARYQESRILLCCSRFESFHISSAEALCCGCSVVVARHPLLASTCWFTGRNSGTLAETRSKASLTDALSAEASAWEKGERDPTHISRTWGSILHSDRVATGLLAALQARCQTPESPIAASPKQEQS